MASKNLMSVNPVTQVNDSDMFYTVQGGTTDGRVSAIQISEFVKLELTKADVGLANVDNTSDLDKPISNATLAALGDKQDELVSGINIKTINGQSVLGTGDLEVGGAVDSVNGQTGTVVLSKADVGLSNVDNTSDVNKPISTATQLALDGKQDELISGTTIKTVNGETILGSGDLAVNGAVDSVNGQTGVVVLTKIDIGLSNVDNTSDLDKPVSTATQLALDDKQDLLQSGVNIKTVNGQSILGSGNVEISGGGSSEIIRTPVAVAPLTGTTEFPVDGTLQASPYAPLYSADTREFREFQIDTVTGDFTAPISVAQVNADTWVISLAIPDNTDLQWRCRDKSVKGDYSEWSEPQTFKTLDVYVVTPVILSPAEGGTVAERDQPITSSEFQIVNVNDTHTATYWTIKNSLGAVVYKTGRDTVNLTSWQPPAGVIVDGESMTVEVVYESSGGYLSEAGVRGFVGAGAPFGKYLAVAHATTPFVTTYGVDVDDFNKLVNPSVLPASRGYGLSFSPDGTHMAVAHDTSPFITIYKREGDTFTKLADPSVLPASRGYGLSFSPDGTHMAVAHATTPFITIYKRSGDTFTKLANPSVLPTGTSYGVAFSPDGTHMVVAHGASPQITIYKRSGDTFTKLANPSVLPTGTGQGTSFSPDGTHMAVAHFAHPFITIYKRSGDTFTKLANPSALPTSTGYGVSFSQDGTHMAVAHDTSPFITIYKIEGDTFTKLANPSVLPTGTVNAVAFWPSSLYPST